jgi:hypothetical protein
MKAVRLAMLESSQAIKEMGKRSEDIGDIVQTVNLIADRTNLLSLNASIEAARAGEHGRGFAVWRRRSAPWQTRRQPPTPTSPRSCACCRARPGTL